MCIDRNNGQVLWERTAWTGEPEESHRMNGWASATCATDGEHVYAFFGRGGGLFCYTVDGTPVWQKDLGRFECPWGTAACPVLYENLVIQNGDSDKNAFIAGYDKETGDEIWRTKREDNRGWSTPIVIDTGERSEIVLNGHTGVRGYDPTTGKELWYCSSFAGRGSPTVAFANGLLHVVSGLRGDVFAIRPGGAGNVSDTHRAWQSLRRPGRDLPSPIVIGGQMLVMDMRRTALTSYDSRTGRQLWHERVGRTDSGQFCASPVAWADIVFFTAESGETFAIRPGAEMEVVSVNSVNPREDEIFRASPTPSEGQVFLRSDSVLYCVGRRVDD